MCSFLPRLPASHILPYKHGNCWARQYISAFGKRFRCLIRKFAKGIECCFKTCKSLLKLGKEFHGVSYDLTVSSTALVFTRFILLEWIRRKHNDDKTIAELFFVCCEDIQDMELSTALRSLISIFATGIRDGSIIIDETVCEQLIGWFVSQPAFIRAIFPEFMSGIGVDEEDSTILSVACCQ